MLDRTPIFRADPFLESYAATMLEDLWHREQDQACEEGREPRDTGTIYEMPDETFNTMRADAERFQREAADDLEAAYNTIYSVDQAGADFYLTRGGHGVGFWDRGLCEVGDRLSARVGYGTDFPPFDTYFGDDGRVYLA